MHRTTLWLVGAVGLGVVLAAQPLPELPLQKMTPGTLSQDGQATYRLVAKDAGVLTVLLVGSGGDMTLEVLDEDGQRLPDGFADSDIGGNSAREQLVVTIPAPGAYSVRVGARGEGARPFEIGAAWLLAPSLTQPPDPDGRPKQARPLQVGKPLDDQVDPGKGDYRDWYVVTSAEAGTLTVVTRGEEGDLVLEAFTGEDFSKSIARSDQDLNGKGTNESIVVEVKTGQRVYLRIMPTSQNRPLMAYRISAGFMR